MDIFVENKSNNVKSQNLDDFKVLENIVSDRAKIEDVDFDTKMRLITMCSGRLEQIYSKTKLVESRNRALEKVKINLCE